MFSATVYLDTHHHAGAIDPRIFGGFLEHLGRCVYEGVYDPGSPHADRNGFRKDVIESLKKLNMPVMRYPGGNFVSAYDWKDGIGPRDKRPRRPDYAWKSIETNQFGTDEFIQWCKLLGTEPMMAVNLGTADPRDAAALLEYCNLSHETYWVQQRRANGHEAPYNVKYWCLGNEMDGPWQAGHRTAIEYARGAWQASKLMKGLDSKIETIVCGSSGRGMRTYLEWDRVVIEECWDTADYLSAHRYSLNNQNNTPWFLAEGLEIDRVLEDYDGLISYVRGFKKNNKNMYLSFDEWNVWYRHRGENGGWVEAPHLLEEEYNLEDALVCAQYLNSFIRRADLVKMACLAQIVNIIAPIMTKKDGLLVQSIYHPIELISRSAKGLSLTPSIESPTYNTNSERGDAPNIDVSVSYNPDSGDASFFIVNRNIDDDAKVTLKLSDRVVTKVNGGEAIGGQDVKTLNTWDKPNAVKRFNADANVVDGAAEVQIKSPGFAAVTVSTKPR